jgi:hypothetical protein
MTALNLQPPPSPRTFTIYASAVRTATTSTLINLDAIDVEALTVVINLTAATGTTPSVTFQLQAIDQLSGATYELGSSTGLTSGAMTTAGKAIFRVAPALTDSSTVAKDMVPPLLLFTATHLNGTGNLTYTVSGIMDL